MRLTELEARFVRYGKDIASEGHGRRLPDGTIQWGGFECDVIQTVDSLAEAQGIRFLCPVCFKANGGSVGTHSVEVTFAGRGVGDEFGSHNSEGLPSRWAVSGTGLDDLTTTPSVFLKGPGCGWHGYITNGDAT